MVTNLHSSKFNIWLLVRKYQKIVFMFIRTHREKKLDIMVSTLQELVLLFFSLDHQNYAWWIPIFLRNLQGLPPSIHKKFKKRRWKIIQSNGPFSSSPIEQSNEQVNKRVKGVGGIIGLRKNHDMLQRWIVTGLEINCFDEEYTGANDNNDDEE